MTREMKQQFTLRITQANKTQMIVVLYEMTLAYLEEAVEAYKEENREDFRDAIRKTRGCIKELLTSLNFRYEPAVNLMQLYLYVNRELALADIKSNVEPIQHCKFVINGLHKAYLEVSKQDTSEPVMVNTQTVYAGLTYGKGELTESLSNQGADRGFRV